MTQRTYRTAQGKVVDLGALQLKNENVRAVGNMSVNARGELIDGSNRPIESRNEQVGRQYKKQTNVNNDAVVSSKKSRIEPSAPPLDEPIFSEDIVDDSASIEAEEPVTGLAAAIARARQVKQEPLKTPRQVAQAKAGVKKI
jgi:hypothetical protein